MKKYQMVRLSGVECKTCNELIRKLYGTNQ